VYKRQIKDKSLAYVKTVGEDYVKMMRLGGCRLVQSLPSDFPRNLR
jgi:hypothetical protein